MPCPLGFDESHIMTSFVKPDPVAGASSGETSVSAPEVTIGLLSNDTFLSLGVALARSPLEDFIQFDKHSIGKLAISESVRNEQPDFAVRYKRPAITMKNYALLENPSIQGFWLSVKPSINKI